MPGGYFSSSNASRFKDPLPLGRALWPCADTVAPGGRVRVPMPEVVVQGIHFSYETVGDGFPLVLTPGPQGRREVWSPYMPLLGELCRVIAYECQEVAQGPQPGGP